MRVYLDNQLITYLLRLDQGKNLDDILVKEDYETTNQTANSYGKTSTASKCIKPWLDI